MLCLYLVRHGVTAWNRELRMQGHADVPLDPEGEEQARRIGNRLATCLHPPEAIWCSDLLRARQTAQAIAAPLGLTLRITPMLRETMLGAWEGLTAQEIAARGEAELLERYQHDSYVHRPPESESLDQVWERMSQAYEQIRVAHPQGYIAVVGHGGSLRVLLCEALNAPITSLRHFALSNASLSIIEDIGEGERRRRRVMLINDTSHLSAES